MKRRIVVKKNLLILQISVAISLLFSFISFLSPVKEYTGQVKSPSFLLIFNLGKIFSYFEQQIVFSVIDDLIFALVLILLICHIVNFMSLFLSFGKGDNVDYAYKGIFAASLSSLICYIILFFVYLNINISMLRLGSRVMSSYYNVFLKIPIGIYVNILLTAYILIKTLVYLRVDFTEISYNLQIFMQNHFKGGIHPDYHKNTKFRRIKNLNPSDVMIYPLSQHIGAMCEPLVKVGDTVKMGQKIADSEAAISSPIHATVSGKVIKIDDWDHPIGNRVKSIFIENDHKDTPDKSLSNKIDDYKELEPEEIISIVHEAGIVGLGGATFPSHIKMQSAMNKTDILIINGAECEPYLSRDHRMMLENPDELIEGIKIIAHTIKAKKAYIGIETNKPNAIKAVNKAISKYKSKMKVKVLHTKYPQGGEKQLIKAITGRVVPSGKLPIDVGCCVFNIDTCIAVYNAVKNSTPLMSCVVTVAGSGVKNEQNYNVRIGTPIKDVLNACGYSDKTKKLIMGGPMMGTAQYSIESPVIKGTSGLLCFTEQEIAFDEDVACIRCGKCVNVCPMNLVPSYIRLYAGEKNFEECKKLGAMDCIECGCCSYICPAKLPLIQYLRLSKVKIKNLEVRAKGGNN